MRKLAVISLLGAMAMVTPAQATKPPSPGGQDKAGKSDKAGKPAKKPAKKGKAARDRCAPRTVGFNASGTLVSSALTPAEPRRFDGTLTVTVTRTNHGAPKGEQTYTLDGARVKFHRGVDAAAPAAGSRVKLHGTITRIAKRCPVGTFTPTITVRKVDIAAPKPPAPPAPPAPPEAPAP